MAAPLHERILILDFGSQVHAAHRAAPARDERLLRDPPLRRRRRLRARVRARRASSSPGGRQRRPRATRRARRRRCSRLACRCSASATACRPWRRSSAARSRPATCASSATRRSARAATRGSFATSRTGPTRSGHGLLDVWMSHGDKVTALPPGFKVIGSNAALRRSPAMADEDRGFYGVQFHPEVTHTRQGAAILARFVLEICGCATDWNMRDYSTRRSRSIRAQVGGDDVILGLSGGVDSSVAAALIHRAIGDQLTCVFVDHGLLRLDEAAAGAWTPSPRNLGVKVVARRRRGRVHGRARRRDRPRAEAQDHRPRVRATSSSARRRSSRRPATLRSGSRRARSTPT